MPAIQSAVSPHSSEFKSNRERMLQLVSEVRDIEARIRAHSERALPKFQKRGQLLPRERVNRLLDPGTDFVELSTLAGYSMHDDDGLEQVAGGGNIVGIGVVRGVRCMVVANDAAIKGGSVSPMGLRKSLRAQEVALENRLPAITLVESGGANLLYQAELFVEGGKIFRNMARGSAAGIPQITVVHGSSTAGGAYLPGLSDYVIMVRNQAKVFLAGPPLVKAALGEEATDEELGGAEMHATITGTAEYLAENDAHGIQLARDIVGSLGWRAASAPPVDVRPPLYDPDELCGAIPPDPRTPYDPREVLARILDGSDFLEFKPGFGSEMVCGHGAIEGERVGLLANQGPIQPQGSVKAAQFIQLCDQAGLPLVYLQNTTGYMVGKEAEQAGAVKHGSKMIQAVSNARVPQITLLIGGGYGAGNYGMCGRAYEPRFLFAWPNARISVMGGEQAAMVMKIITRAKLTARGLPVSEEALDAMSGSIREQLDKESLALFASARLWDDGIIDPRDSRKVLGLTLRICREAGAVQLRPNTYGVARG